MEKWGWICLLLCLVGFLKEFRPNESFGVEYLVGPWQNETNDEVYYIYKNSIKIIEKLYINSYLKVMQLVFPVWTYSYVALLFVVFLITDYLLYKPVVVCEALSFTIFYIILIWGYGIPAMQVLIFLLNHKISCSHFKTFKRFVKYSTLQQQHVILLTVLTSTPKSRAKNFN